MNSTQKQQIFFLKRSLLGFRIWRIYLFHWTSCQSDQHIYITNNGEEGDEEKNSAREKEQTRAILYIISYRTTDDPASWTYVTRPNSLFLHPPSTGLFNPDTQTVATLTAGIAHTHGSRSLQISIDPGRLQIWLIYVLNKKIEATSTVCFSCKFSSL